MSLLNRQISSIVMASIAIFALAHRASAQLPFEVQGDRGPDVPAAMRIRPGYRVTRALAPAAIPDVIRAIRFLQFSEDGKTLYISDNDRATGTIYALRDPDADGMYKTITKFVTNKSQVQGMDVHGGWLYFSQASDGSCSRARDTNGDGVADDLEVVISANSVPPGGGHPFEGLLVTDKEIYMTASDPQNMTLDLPSERKTIYAFDIDGKNKRIFCAGIRNTEKIRLRPGTTDIYGFDHGSDNFGATYGEKAGSNQPITDVNPNEEFNKYVQDGFYGHPFIMGNGVPRPENSKREDILELANKTIAPEWLVHAHWAVLGWTFASKDYFPGTKGDVFFASHGSWNSTKPTGAVIQRIMFDQLTGKPMGSMTIIDCQGPPGTPGPQGRVARPVDLAEAPDGTLIFSSDTPPALYRISKSSIK